MRLPSFLERLRSGWGALSAAAAWAVFDALVHVAVDQVEPARIAGNVVVLAALGVSWLAVRRAGGAKLAAAACGVAALAVFGLNLAWATANGALPIPAAVFITVCFGLLLLAAWRFLAEAGAGLPEADGAATDTPSEHS